jgi:type I restriction enzyme M protein
LDYWREVMLVDCYLIAAEGWVAEPSRIIEMTKNGKEKDKGWECELLPKQLIINHYFSREQAEIATLALELDSVTSRLADIEEEGSGEDGPLSELEKLNKVCVAARLKEVGGEGEGQEEFAILNAWLELNARESQIKKQIKDVEDVVDAKAYQQYSRLSASDIKELVVNSKWLNALAAAIGEDIERLSQRLTGRTLILGERYETTVPELTERQSTQEKTFAGVFRSMGFSWL